MISPSSRCRYYKVGTIGAVYRFIYTVISKTRWLPGTLGWWRRTSTQHVSAVPVEEQQTCAGIQGDVPHRGEQSIPRSLSPSKGVECPRDVPCFYSHEAGRSLSMGHIAAHRSVRHGALLASRRGRQKERSRLFDHIYRFTI